MTPLRFEAVQLTPIQCVRFKEVLALRKLDAGRTTANVISEMAGNLKGIKQLNEEGIKVKFRGFPEKNKLGRKGNLRNPIYRWQNKELPGVNVNIDLGFIEISKAEKKFGGQRVFYTEFAKQILATAPGIEEPNLISVQIIDNSENVEYAVITDFNIVPVSNNNEGNVSEEINKSVLVPEDESDILSDQIMLLQILKNHGLGEAISNAVSDDEKKFLAKFADNKDLKQEIEKLEKKRGALSSIKT